MRILLALATMSVCLSSCRVYRADDENVDVVANDQKSVASDNPTANQIADTPAPPAPVAVSQPDVDCDKPPYGSTDAAFRGFAQNMNKYVAPTSTTLAG